MNTSAKNVKWYRQPLVWMIILIPFSAILGGISMIYLAVTTDDGLVNDDYYQYGKQINLVLERDIEAKRLELNAQFELETKNGAVSVTLNGNNIKLPDDINLSLLHATKANQDQHINLLLTPAKTYHGLIENLIPGKWYVQLHTKTWRLSAEIIQPGNNTIQLIAK